MQGKIEIYLCLYKNIPIIDQLINSPLSSLKKWLETCFGYFNLHLCSASKIESICILSLIHETSCTIYSESIGRIIAFSKLIKYKLYKWANFFYYPQFIVYRETFSVRYSSVRFISKRFRSERRWIHMLYVIIRYIMKINDFYRAILSQKYSRIGDSYFHIAIKSSSSSWSYPRRWRSEWIKRIVNSSSLLCQNSSAWEII